MLQRIAILVVLLSAAAFADGDRMENEGRKRNRAAVDGMYRDNLRKYRKNRDMLVLPGLLASRRDKWIRLHGEATAVGTNDPVEFVLIAENSGHDYESIAVSLAGPSDIHKALVFIGMKPGNPVDYNKARFWPKGERVLLTFEWEDAVTKKHRRAPAESLILDKRTGKPLPAGGFVFAGSVWKEDLPSFARTPRGLPRGGMAIEASAVALRAMADKTEGSAEIPRALARGASPDRPGRRTYAADRFGPNSIASVYNDPETVLDVPVQAPQHGVYGSQFPNPEYSFTKGQLIEVVMEPEYKDGKRRVADLTLRVDHCAGAPASGSMTNLAFVLNDADGKRLNKGPWLEDVLAVFEELVSAGRDPHVTVDLAGALPLGVIREFCAFLANIDKAGGIRIEPPLPGQLYYKAFLPDEKLRERAGRIAQPWEFRIAETNGTVSGTFTLIDEVRSKDGEGWKTRTRDFEAATPAVVRKVLGMKEDDGSSAGLPVVFVFASKTIRYSTLMSLAASMIETHPTVFVYMD